MIGFLTMLLRECLFFLGYVTGGQQYPQAADDGGGKALPD